MQRIEKLRFKALAGYAQDPRALLIGEELQWFEHAGGKVLGAVIRDRTDGDYAGMVFARDELLQYRWTDMTTFERSQRWAQARLRPLLEQAAVAPDETHFQGHQHKVPVDFFTPVVAADRLHSDFKNLIELEGFSPARGIIEPMMRWYDDVDGNFVEQFQTTAFDARLWELYLFATLVELGFAVDRSEPAPDFVAWSLGGEVAIEAVTVNPTRDSGGLVIEPPPLDTAERRVSYLKEYMPIKFGSALYSKFVRDYWALAHVRGKPFALAIEDFSSPGSLVMTRSALQLYLYGYDYDRVEEDEKVVMKPRRVTSHRWQSKEIPSGFFFLAGAENVSAVIFSNSGTIGKFARMGQIAGFGSRRVGMIREGFAYDPNSDAAVPLPFRRAVGDGYEEAWIEGLEVYHNPRAVAPLDPGLFPGAAHMRLQQDGQIAVIAPAWHPLSSKTLIGTPSE